MDLTNVIADLTVQRDKLSACIQTLEALNDVTPRQNPLVAAVEEGVAAFRLVKRKPGKWRPGKRGRPPAWARVGHKKAVKS